MVAAQISSAVLKHNRDMVLSSYRTLLRATRIAFKGDDHMLMASRKHVRHNFDENRNAAPGSVEAHEGVAHAQATAQILRENVVQGESAGDQKYKLNIHEHTERGDDSEFKKFKGSSKKFSDMKN